MASEQEEGPDGIIRREDGGISSVNLTPEGNTEIITSWDGGQIATEVHDSEGNVRYTARTSTPGRDSVFTTSETHADGTAGMATINRDGTVTTTELNADGTFETVHTLADGTVEKTVKQADGDVVQSRTTQVGDHQVTTELSHGGTVAFESDREERFDTSERVVVHTFGADTHETEFINQPDTPGFIGGREEVKVTHELFGHDVILHGEQHAMPEPSLKDPDPVEPPAVTPEPDPPSAFPSMTDDMRDLL